MNTDCDISKVVHTLQLLENAEFSNNCYLNDFMINECEQ